MLKLHIKAEQHAQFDRLLDYGLRAAKMKYILPDNPSHEDRTLYHIAKTLYTCSSDYRTMDYDLRMYIANMLQWYSDYLDKEGVELEAVCHYLRQYPVAQEILAYTEIPRRPLGYQRTTGEKEDESIGVVHTRNGFLAV